MDAKCSVCWICMTHSECDQDYTRNTMYMHGNAKHVFFGTHLGRFGSADHLPLFGWLGKHNDIGGKPLNKKNCWGYNLCFFNNQRWHGISMPMAIHWDAYWYALTMLCYFFYCVFPPFFVCIFHRVDGNIFCTNCISNLHCNQLDCTTSTVCIPQKMYMHTLYNPAILNESNTNPIAMQNRIGDENYPLWKK